MILPVSLFIIVFKKNDFEQWLLAPVGLLRLYGSSFHCPMAMATLATLRHFPHHPVPSLSLSLSLLIESPTRQHRVMKASTTLRRPQRAIADPPTTTSPLPPSSFSFPLFLFLLPNSSIHFYVGSCRSSPYRLIQPTSQNNLRWWFQKPWI